MRNDKLRISIVNSENEVGVIIDNSRKSNCEDILDLFDSIYLNDRTSNSSFYIIENHLVRPEDELAKYKFIKFKNNENYSIELSKVLFNMLDGLLVDLSA